MGKALPTLRRRGAELASSAAQLRLLTALDLPRSFPQALAEAGLPYCSLPELLKHYFTDEKVIQTLALCAAHGLDTMILRVDEDTLRIIRRFRAQGMSIIFISHRHTKDDWSTAYLAIVGKD